MLTVIIRRHHRGQNKVFRNLAQTHHCLLKAGPLKRHGKIMVSPSGFCLKVDSCNLSILSWKLPWEGTLGKQFVSLLTKTGSLEVCGSSTSLRLPSNCWEVCQIWRFCGLLTACDFFPLPFTSEVNEKPWVLQPSWDAENVLIYSVSEIN